MQKGAKAQRDIEREEAIVNTKSGRGTEGRRGNRQEAIVNSVQTPKKTVIPSEARNLTSLQCEHRFLASLGMTEGERQWAIGNSGTATSV